MTKARLGLLVLVAIGVGLFFATTVRAEPPGGEGEGEKTSLAPSKANKPAKHGWLFECTTPSGGLNTTLDCDDPFPNNEPNIVVDPTNPQHLISSSNDYGSCCDQYYTTFNAGATWSTGNMSVEDSSRTGSDPVTAFDVKHHVALHSSLNYTFNDDGRDLRRRRGRLALARRRALAGRSRSSSTAARVATSIPLRSSTTRSGSPPTTTRARSSTAAPT